MLENMARDVKGAQSVLDLPSMATSPSFMDGPGAPMHVGQFADLDLATIPENPRQGLSMPKSLSMPNISSMRKTKSSLSMRDYFDNIGSPRLAEEQPGAVGHSVSRPALPHRTRASSPKPLARPMLPMRCGGYT